MHLGYSQEEHCENLEKDLNVYFKMGSDIQQRDASSEGES